MHANGALGPRLRCRRNAQSNGRHPEICCFTAGYGPKTSSESHRAATPPRGGGALRASRRQNWHQLSRIWAEMELFECSARGLRCLMVGPSALGARRSAFGVRSHRPGTSPSSRRTIRCRVHGPGAIPQQRRRSNNVSRLLVDFDKLNQRAGHAGLEELLRAVAPSCVGPRRSRPGARAHPSPIVSRETYFARTPDIARTVSVHP